jgi:hypothetical protein
MNPHKREVCHQYLSSLGRAYQHRFIPEFFAQHVCISYIPAPGIGVPGGLEGESLKEARAEKPGGLNADRWARRA